MSSTRSRRLALATLTVVAGLSWSGTAVADPCQTLAAQVEDYNKREEWAKGVQQFILGGPAPAGFQDLPETQRLELERVKTAPADEQIKEIRAANDLVGQIQGQRALVELERIKKKCPDSQYAKAQPEKSEKSAKASAEKKSTEKEKKSAEKKSSKSAKKQTTASKPSASRERSERSQGGMDPGGAAAISIFGGGLMFSPRGRF
jgi:hypothetical protein